MVEESKPFNIRTRNLKTFQTRNADGRIQNVEGTERVNAITEARRLEERCMYGDVIVHCFGADSIAQGLKVYGIMQLKSPKKFAVIEQNGRSLDTLEFLAPVDTRVPDRDNPRASKAEVIPKKTTKGK